MAAKRPPTSPRPTHTLAVSEETAAVVIASEVVIDACLFLNFALGAHPYHIQTRQFLAQCGRSNTSLIAPMWWEAEADSALRRMVVAGQLSAPAAATAQQLLDAAPVTVVYEPAARAVARALADRAHQTKVYDATYAALAQVRGCELWTADERFYNAVTATLPYVRFIGSYTPPATDTPTPADGARQVSGGAKARRGSEATSS